MIELSHVSKTFAPTFGRPARALDDISLRVAAGEVAGVSGPAGSGKSTLLSLVLGHGRPTSGTVRIDGIEARRFVEREGMAYLPQRLSLPGRWRVADALTRMAMLSGVRASETRQRVDAAIRDLALGDDRRRRLKSLSQDALARFGLAQSILADRRVIVLDEPLDGLSTESLELLRGLIVRLRAFDRAIVIASRDTAELQRMTDRVTFVDHGRIRRVGAQRPTTPANVDAVFQLQVHHGAGQVIAVFPTAISLGRGAYSVRVSVVALNRGLRELLDRGVLLTSVAPVNATIEPSAAAVLDEVVT
ncbi:MAG TPA: ABC transporter ATP-binding protein [Gemmatimonadaceae bacterium]|nr:ABC transporter ATP-binding protein [Gemmatimonadaceae bacterium]